MDHTHTHIYTYMCIYIYDYIFSHRYHILKIGFCGQHNIVFYTKFLVANVFLLGEYLKACSQMWSIRFNYLGTTLSCV